MGRAKTIARRGFIIGSVAVAGGVAFGTYAYRKPHPNPLLDDLREGEAAITPFVRIDAEGITLITPRADKGQGAYSMQAYLLAEELDVDPKDVRTEPGPPDPAYYNAAVLAEGAPFATYDQSWLARQARDFMAVPAKLLGMQMTGGSSTVPDCYVRLREAGAVARETLKAAAAQKYGLTTQELRTADGQVLLPNGDRVDYTTLASDAAMIDPIDPPALRPASEWRYLGKPMQRIDIVRKSTGTETYGIDLRLPGMLYATVRTNPGIGAGVRRYDASAAAGMRGVQQVVEIHGGVAVIADNSWRAMKAVDAIEIEWEPGPFPATTEEMWQSVRTTLDDDDYDSRNRDDGDVDDAFESGDVVTAEYRIPYLAHAPLEPMNAVVQVSNDRVDVWTGTQIPRFVQQHVSDLTGRDLDDVHVHVQPMGGSFGRRLEDTYVLQATEIAMAVPGTAVKMTWSREEDMAHDYPRPMQMSRARGKVVDGQIDAFDLNIAAQSVTSSWFGRLMFAPPGPDVAIVAGAWDQPLSIPNYRVTGKRVPEMAPVSSWRSVGASGNGFLHGGFLDELFAAANIDPLQGLIDLCHHDVSRLVLEKLRELSGWEGRSLGVGRGRGVAYCLSFGVPTAEVVEVTRTAQGIRIDRVFVVTDVGTVLDPINLDAQLAGGAIFGLGHAMNCELTYSDHKPLQTNYHLYQAMRIQQAPEVVTFALENGDAIRGAGEPAVPPAAPALANAIFAATGQRIRELPLDRHVKFV